MRLIFFRGAVDTLDDFTVQLMRAAETLSMEYLLLDIRENGSTLFDKLSGFVSGEPCTAILLNNVGLNLVTEQGNFWERNGIPVCDILMDHPRNYDMVLRRPFDNLHVFVIDRNHASFIQVFFPDVRHVHFLPHGGNRVFTNEPEIPWEERPMDVLLVSNCQQAVSYPAIPFLEDGGKDLYETMIRSLLNDTHMSADDALLSYLEVRKHTLTLEQIEHLMMEHVIYAECTVRRIHKLRIMELLADAGIRTDVYGAHWDDVKTGNGSGIVLHPPVTAAECNALLGQAKIGLNVQPWFKEGAHDRIFTAQLSGAIALTDESNYLKERFTDGRELIFYSLDDLDALPGRIHSLLSDPERSKEIAKTGRTSALRHDTWAERLRTILQTCPASSAGAL